MLRIQNCIIRIHYGFDHANKQTPTFTAARMHSLAEQKLFDHVTNFWAGISKSITEGRLDEARKLFDVEKEPELLRFFAGFSGRGRA